MGPEIICVSRGQHASSWDFSSSGGKPGSLTSELLCVAVAAYAGAARAAKAARASL